MVARVWHGWTVTANADRYEQLLSVSYPRWRRILTELTYGRVMGYLVRPLPRTCT